MPNHPRAGTPDGHETASDEAAKMKITYRISKQDNAAYLKFIQRRVARLAKIPLSWKVAVWVLLVALFVLADRLSKSDLIRELLPVSADTSMVVFMAIVFGGFSYLYLKILNNRMISMMATEDGPYIGDFSLETVSDGFVGTTKCSQGRFDWNAVCAVEENDGYVYIMIDNGSGLPIPVSAFSSPQEKRDFVEIFTSKMRK